MLLERANAATAALTRSGSDVVVVAWLTFVVTRREASIVARSSSYFARSERSSFVVTVAVAEIDGGAAGLGLGLGLGALVLGCLGMLSSLLLVGDGR